MAKKKTIDIKTITAEVPAGDVNISYKNTRIAGLSESVTAVLETKDTICEDDIEVEYTKPGAGQFSADITRTLIEGTTATLTVDGTPVTGNTLNYTGGKYVTVTFSTTLSGQDHTGIIIAYTGDSLSNPGELTQRNATFNKSEPGTIAIFMPAANAHILIRVPN